jgi:hypothetical protein
MLGNKDDIDQLVLRREGERLWAEHILGQNSYGKPSGDLPAMNSFPPEGRDVMQSFNLMIESFITGNCEKKCRTTDWTYDSTNKGRFQSSTLEKMAQSIGGENKKLIERSGREFVSNTSGLLKDDEYKGTHFISQFQ